MSSYFRKKRKSVSSFITYTNQYKREKGRPLNADETLLAFFEQRAYQLIMAVRENYGRTNGSIENYYRQLLIYLEGIGWMVRYGRLDPRMRAQPKKRMEVILKVFSEMDSISTQDEKCVVDS